MGTAVLYPQDCLRSQSRHKHQTTGMIYPSECTSMSKRNSLPPAQSQEVGLLPLPGQRGHSSPINIPRRGSNTKHFRCRRGVEQRDRDYSLRSVPDVPVYQILQLPKQADSVVNELAQFIEVEARSEKNASTKKHQNESADSVDECNNCVKSEFGASNIKSDGFKHRNRGFDSKPVKVCCKGGSVYDSKDVSKILNGNQISAAEGYKFPSAKVGAVKVRSAPVDKVQVGLNGSVKVLQPSRVTPKPFMTKATGKVNDVSCKAVIVQRFEEHHRLLPCLRRMSTEPQISSHILGQYNSKSMHLSYEKTKSHAHGGGICDNASSVSCEERWAGSAYTCSPSPSSLPLPKLCLPQTRFSSLEIPSLVKQYSTSVYMQPFLGSSAPSENGGAWDVAFATKSLRKMLNLDPC